MFQGQIKNHKKQKEFVFIDFNDGTYFKSLQVVYDNTLSNFKKIKAQFEIRITKKAAIETNKGSFTCPTLLKTIVVTKDNPKKKYVIIEYLK